MAKVYILLGQPSYTKTTFKMYNLYIKSPNPGKLFPVSSRKQTKMIKDYLFRVKLLFECIQYKIKYNKYYLDYLPDIFD